MNKLLSILFSSLLITVVAYADPVTVPNTFSAGTPAKASEVNANFTALANAVNANAPLMVYDSTGKVVGSYFYGSKGQPENFVLIKTPSISFALTFDYRSLGNDGYLSSFFRDTAMYTTSNCTGTAYLYSNFGNAQLRTPVLHGVIGATASGFASPIVSIGNYEAELIEVRSFGYFDGTSCNSTSGQQWAYPIIATFDLSTLNLTPPFSVH